MYLEEFNYGDIKHQIIVCAMSLRQDFNYLSQKQRDQ